MPLPILVAIAAPSTPIAGIGPQPKMNMGSKIILIMFAIINAFIAMAALPAPLKMALIRKRNVTV